MTPSPEILDPHSPYNRASPWPIYELEFWNATIKWKAILVVRAPNAEAGIVAAKAGFTEHDKETYRHCTSWKILPESALDDPLSPEPAKRCFSWRVYLLRRDGAKERMAVLADSAERAAEIIWRGLTDHERNEVYVGPPITWKIEEN